MAEKSDDLRRQLADVDAAHLRRLEDLGKVQDRAELFQATLGAIESMGYDALVQGEHNKLIDAVLGPKRNRPGYRVIVGKSLLYVDSKGNQRADIDHARQMIAKLAFGGKQKDQADG